MQKHRTTRELERSENQRTLETAQRPFLLPRYPVRRPRTLLSWWHLLSLDAPTVAATWTWFIAHCCGVTIPWSSPTAMFVVVWMLYATDRLLDARPHSTSTPHYELEERHRFHAQHQRAFLIGITLCALTVPFLLHHLSFGSLKLYAALGSLLFAYFFLIHLWPTTEHKKTTKASRLPKELAVGIFFAAAVFIPTVARNPLLRLSLLPFALIFAVTCTLNCLYVYAWEHPGKHQAAHWTTRFALRHLTSFTCMLLLAAVTMSILLPSGFAPLSIAAALSAVGFLLLDLFRDRLRATDLRAAVDLALLSPLPLLASLYLAKR